VNAVSQKAKATKKGNEKSAEETATKKRGKGNKNTHAEEDDGAVHTQGKASVSEPYLVFHSLPHFTYTYPCYTCACGDYGTTVGSIKGGAVLSSVNHKQSQTIC
jgi:hypothetical protein